MFNAYNKQKAGRGGGGGGAKKAAGWGAVKDKVGSGMKMTDELKVMIDLDTTTY